MGLSPFFLSGAYYQEHATTRLFAVSLVRLPAATLDAGAFPVHIFGLVSSVIRTGFSRGEAVWPRISGPAC